MRPARADARARRVAARWRLRLDRHRRARHRHPRRVPAVARLPDREPAPTYPGDRHDAGRPATRSRGSRGPTPHGRSIASSWRRRPTRPRSSRSPRPRAWTSTTSRRSRPPPTAGWPRSEPPHATPTSIRRAVPPTGSRPRGQARCSAPGSTACRPIGCSSCSTPWPSSGSRALSATPASRSPAVSRASKHSRLRAATSPRACLPRHLPTSRFAGGVVIRSSRRRLPQRAPLVDQSERNLRAASWFMENGSFDPAMRHLMAAGRLEEAGRYLSAHENALFEEGRGQAAAAWYASLPPDSWGQLGWHLVRMGWGQAISRDPHAAGTTVAQLRAHLAVSPADGAEQRVLQAETATLTAYLASMSGDTTAAIGSARRAIDLFSEESPGQLPAAGARHTGPRAPLGGGRHRGSTRAHAHRLPAVSHGDPARVTPPRPEGAVPDGRGSHHPGSPRGDDGPFAGWPASGSTPGTSGSSA